MKLLILIYGKAYYSLYNKIYSNSLNTWKLIRLNIILYIQRYYLILYYIKPISHLNHLHTNHKILL